MIPGEAVDLDKGYYHGVYVLLNFNKEDDVDRKDEQADMEAYPGKEDVEDMIIGNERKHHWRMFFEENEVGVDDVVVVVVFFVIDTVHQPVRFFRIMRWWSYNIRHLPLRA